MTKKEKIVNYKNSVFVLVELFENACINTITLESIYASRTIADQYRYKLAALVNGGKHRQGTRRIKSLN